MANDVQLDSFVKKFKQLIYFGHTAHLEADTHAGQASVSLRVMLGTASRPKQQRRSPSYFRRQEKRKAARQQAADATKLQEAKNASKQQQLQHQQQQLQQQQQQHQAKQQQEDVNASQEPQITSRKRLISISRTGEVNETSDVINKDVDRVITEKVNSVESSKESSQELQITSRRRLISISRTGEVNEISDDINNDVDRVITEKVNSVESSKDNKTNNNIINHEFKCELCDFETQRKAEFDDHMLKEHVIAIEQIDGNTSVTCNEPSVIEMSESLSSFTDAFQVGDITLSSSMNESLSPSTNTSTTNKPRRTSNKQKKNQINLEDDDKISMASSPGENAKEPEMTPRRTTIPKRRRSISSPAS